jgi:hypothetical protein
MNPCALYIKAGFPTLDHPCDLRLPLYTKEWLFAVAVPDHGNGWYVTDLHRLSFYPEKIYYNFTCYNSSGTFMFAKSLYSLKYYFVNKKYGENSDYVLFLCSQSKKSLLLKGLLK